MCRINNVSLANAKDLAAYFAYGGRPPPAIYMSSNVLGMYAITQSPTVDMSQVGFSQAYTDRCKMMTKFLIANGEIMRGRGAVGELRTHMNPRHISRFNPNDLHDWVIEPQAVSVSSSESFKWAVPGIESYESFIRMRQAAAVNNNN